MSAFRIETERLVLRLPGLRDAEAIFHGFANLNVVRNLDNPPWPYTRADAERHIYDVCKANVEGHGMAYAVLLDDTLVGMAGVRARDGEPYLGYWIAEPYWGRGLATEACAGLIRHFFANRADERLSSGALKDNPASIKVLGKLGFEETGEDQFVSRIRNATVPNVNMVLRRRRFEEFNT